MEEESQGVDVSARSPSAFHWDQGSVQLLISIMIHDQVMTVPTPWITCTETHTAKRTLVIRSDGPINQHVGLKSHRFHPSWPHYFLINPVCTKPSRAAMHGLNTVWVSSLFFKLEIQMFISLSSREILFFFPPTVKQECLRELKL